MTRARGSSDYENVAAMNVPPKISEIPSRTIPVEVLPPESHAGGGTGAGLTDSQPIHALSALILVAVDSLWAVFDWAPPIWPLAIPFCFLAVFVPTFLIQKQLKRDSTGRALTFASVLAVLAAIPTFVTGTPVGLALLAWTGLGRLIGRGG